MKKSKLALTAVVACLLIATGSMSNHRSSFAQEQQAVAEASDQQPAPEPLSDEELEILVARIALYPDELVAVIVSSSLYPLQIVQAQRFLDQIKSKPDLKPDADWDGSVISLLNYPEIVKMMSDDLDWTEALGAAVTNQQKDVLTAIQQLREKAVADGIIKSDDKVKVVTENDNIVIQPASAEVVYVPQYAPEMLYVPDYAPAPVAYYPDPYPNYYYPTAPYFAAFVTGAVWGAVVDWNDWGVWGGRWNNDLDIDCNNCFNNNFRGKVNINDVDWRNVDRSKIGIDRNQFNKVDKSKFKNSIKADNRNSVRSKSSDLRKSRPAAGTGKGKQVKDVRKSTLDGLKSKPGQGADRQVSRTKPDAGSKMNKPKTGEKAHRKSGKPKPAAHADNRRKNPSPMGEVKKGKKATIDSNRGGKSMGGGMNRGGGGGGHKAIKRGGGGRRR